MFRTLGLAFLSFYFLVFFNQAYGQSLSQKILDARKPNKTESQFIQRNALQQSDTLLLFIHGIFGDTLKTWSTESGPSLPEIILKRDEFSKNIDAYAFGYASSIVGSGSFSVTEAAKSLKATWDYENFSKYKRVILVAHSMGGLIALEALTTYSDMREKVVTLVTYSTPYNGAEISTIATKLIANKALSDMFPADKVNGFIDSLTTRWKQYKQTTENPILIKCAYETIPIPLTGLIVQKTSGQALCDGPADPIAEDHIGISKPSGPNHDSVKVLVNALRGARISADAKTTPSILLKSIRTSKLSEEAIYVEGKIHRNIAELFNDAGHVVSAPPLTVESTPKGRHNTLNLIVSQFENNISAELQFEDAEGKIISNAEITGPIKELVEIYKSIPAALIYELDIDNVTLKIKNSAKLQTRNTLAYAHYLYAARKLQNNSQTDSEQHLTRATQIDPSFAMAYWALGEITHNEDLIKRAVAIDPDHGRISLASLANQDNPVPSLTNAIKAAQWRRLPSGLGYLHISDPAFGIELRAWSLTPAEFNVSIVEQSTSFGSPVSEHLKRGPGVLAVGGGFFNKDSKGRLTPAGLLVVDGTIRNSSKGTASGVLAIRKGGKPEILWAKDISPLTQYQFLVQSGPVLVEKNGVNGIKRDDFDRLNRTAVCSRLSDFLVIDIHGKANRGLSLFQLASILGSPQSDGGLNCTMALNLDGGPSTQAAYRDGGEVKTVSGLWKVNNSILVSSPLK
jgi:hypothetical protein